MFKGSGGAYGGPDGYQNRSPQPGGPGAPGGLPTRAPQGGGGGGGGIRLQVGKVQDRALQTSLIYENV